MNKPSGHFSASQRAVLTIVLGSYLMLLLDTSIVITGLPSIKAEFNLSPVWLSWVSTAYLLGFGGFMLLGARAGDILGRKRVFLWGLALFTLASGAVGLATTAPIMIAARFAQGIGAAVLAPTTLALLQLNFAEGPERTRALSAYAATAGIGASAGLVLGGVMAGLASWRWGFLVNVPAGLALLVVARRILVDTAGNSGQLDLPGSVVSTAGMTALVYGITLGGETTWLRPLTLGMIITGFGLLTLFLRMQARRTNPLLPLGLFASRSRLGAYAARMMFVSTMMGFFFLTTQLLQGPLGMAPERAGIGFLPMTVMTLAASLTVPALTRQLGNGRVVLLAFVLLGVGIVGLALADPAVGYLRGLALPLTVLGFGNGMALGPLTQAGMQGVAPVDAGAAAGLVNTVHQLGGALGIAFSAAISAALGIPAGLWLGAVACLGGVLLTQFFLIQAAPSAS